MPRVSKVKSSLSPFLAGYLPQAHGQFGTEQLPLAEISALWSSLDQQERQALFSFDQSELLRQAVKRTRQMVDEAKAVHTAVQEAKRHEHERTKQARAADPNCSTGSPGLGKAEMVQLQATLLEQYAVALKRLKQGGGYKRWRFSKDTPEFTDPQAFREYLEQDLVKPELRKLLPRSRANASEASEQLALCATMSEVYEKFGKDIEQLQRMAQELHAFQTSTATHSVASRKVLDLDKKIKETCLVILESITDLANDETSSLRHAIFTPMAEYVHRKLDPSQNPGGTADMLSWNDLYILHPADLRQLTFWLYYRLMVFSSGHAQALLQIDAQPQDQEEGKLQNVDCFVLTDGGNKVALNPHWMQHLQMLIYDKQLQKWKCTPAPPKGPPADQTGALLAWALGQYEPTFEQARKLVHLDELPSPQKTFQMLEDALKQRQEWAGPLKHHQVLAATIAVLETQLNEACRHHDIRFMQPGSGMDNVSKLDRDGLFEIRAPAGTLERQSQLPDNVLLLLIKRESLSGLASAETVRFSIKEIDRQIGSFERHLAQTQSVYDERKAAFEEGEVLKDRFRRMRVPRGFTQDRCKDAGCDRPMCKAAEALQKQIPALDFATARDLASQEDLFRDISNHRQGFSTNIEQLQCERGHFSEALRDMKGRSNFIAGIGSVLEDCKPGMDVPYKLDLASGRITDRNRKNARRRAAMRSQDTSNQDLAAPAGDGTDASPQHQPSAPLSDAEAAGDSTPAAEEGTSAPQESTSAADENMAAGEQSPPADDKSITAAEVRAWCQSCGLELQKLLDLVKQRPEGASVPDCRIGTAASDFEAVFEALSPEAKEAAKDVVRQTIKRRLVPVLFDNWASRDKIKSLQRSLASQITAMEQKQAQHRAVLVQLEAQVINAACDNPGVTVVDELLLPMVRERLLDKVAALQQQAAKAKAEDDRRREATAQSIMAQLIAEEEQQKAKAATKAAKKAQQKARKK